MKEKKVKTPPDKLLNVLGALSLTVADRVERQADELVGMRGIAAATIIAINLDSGVLIERLAKQLGRSQSSMVRTAQELVRQGLVEKKRGVDRRTFELYLTQKGRKCARSILTARNDILRHALSTLTADDCIALQPIIERVLEGLVHRVSDQYSMCRLCDEKLCGNGGECPVERGVTLLA